MSKNILTQAKKKKADESAQAGRLQEACSLYEAVCKTDRADVEAWVKLGETHRQLGNYIKAEECARRGVTLQPNLGFAHYVLGAALQCQGKLRDAIVSYTQAVKVQPTLADAHYLLGNALFETGNTHGAIERFREALALRPNLIGALSDLGAALIALGHEDEARDVLTRALQVNPHSPQALANLASLDEKHGRFDEALTAYRRAIVIAPESVAVAAKLAALLERANRLDEAQEVISSGLAKAPADSNLNLVAARVERRAGRLEEAAARLEGLLGQELANDVAAEAHLLLGQIYDVLGKTVEVFKHLAAGKRLVAVATDPDGTASDRYLARIAEFRALLPTADEATTIAASTPPANDTPIFLVGFPRSGTTLLEQILDSHPHLQALDERPMVAMMEREFRSMTDGSSAALRDLSTEQIGKLRAAYFAEASRYVSRRSEAQLVDKLPLNIVAIPLIWRVFPTARFILAIRHPCDVALSCFMQNFGHNDAMSSFVSLPKIATMYERVMAGWREYAEFLPLRTHRLRYEDLIANFEREARAVCTFLDLPWHERLLDHVEHAKSREAIKTPSYHQVTQPIYQHARYRWRRYEAEFETVLPTLDAYIKYFDYA